MRLQESPELIARHNLDIPVSIGERAVGADLQGIEEARIHEGIAGIELQRLRRQIDLGLDALAARPAHVLEVAKTLQLRTRDRQDVIGIGRAECADLPSQRSDIQLLRAAEAGLNGAGDDLFQRRIGDEECGDDTGARRIGACSSSGVGARLASE